MTFGKFKLSHGNEKVTNDDDTIKRQYIKYRSYKYFRFPYTVHMFQRVTTPAALKSNTWEYLIPDNELDTRNTQDSFD